MPQQKLTPEELALREMTQGRKPWQAKLLEKNAALATEARRRQVRQYTEPESDVLPRQEFRPSDLSRNRDLPFRSMQDYLPLEIGMPPEIAGKPFRDLSLPMKLPTEPQVLKAGPRGYAIPSRYLNHNLGLGTATNGIGVDASGKPYLSIYDLWDFAGELWPLGPMLRAAGKPYNIYDRVPFDLVNGRIPETITTRGFKKDINLPVEPKSKGKK